MRFVLITPNTPPAEHLLFAEQMATKMGKEFAIETTLPDDWEEYAAANAVDLYFISCTNNRKEIQSYLNACRNLRLPYVFLTDSMVHIGRNGGKIQRIIMPVSMLEEEVHKAEIGVHVARFHEAETILLQAHDYGSKAKTNTQKIYGLYDKFELPIQVEEARKDSFGLMKEVADRQKDWVADLVIITASREYGLDDLFFGPPERYTIMHSISPVMLINPRGDLFSLCD